MATSCFPTAVGVPGNSTPPDWIAPGAAPFDGSPDDPRWVGALAHSLGDGTGIELLFRSLVRPGNTHLLLSWLVKVDPLITAGADSLFVGFGSAATAMVVRIQLATSAPTPPGPQTAPTAYTPDTVMFVGGAWGGFAGSAPAWVASGTRAWINYGTPSTPFAIQMLVPVNQFLDAGSTIKIIPGTSFKMWYSAYVDSPAEGNPSVIEYFWPGTSGIGMTAPPAPSNWADVRVSTIVADPACNQTGITIDVLDIGTKNFDGTNRPDANLIKFDATGADANPPNHTNQFFAHPTFPFADVTRRGEVRARFRMANWGSQIGTLTSDSWTTIPGGDAVPCDTSQLGGECHFIWPTNADLGSSILTRFRSGTSTADQCILVELSSVHAGGEIFLHDSIRRNMWLAPASTFSREAEISIVGLQPISPVPRDVYLYVETVNMPVRVPQDQPPPDLTHAFSAKFTTDTGLAAAVGKKPTIEDLIKFVPTYRVHVYHDTGRRTKMLGGGERRILSPQSSFGYFLQHEGPLEGWDARLQGAIRIAEAFYLLRIDNNGTAKVKTVVQGREPGDPILPQDPIVKEPPPIKPPDGGCGCLGWLTKLFGKKP
jgi:hypothetical protein